MLAVSVQFRYADFVRFWGGSDFDLGRIVGVGMIGALLMRWFQGIGIDRYGALRIWLLSLIGYTLASAGHTQIDSLDTPTVYLLRILMATSTAGAFGSSLTFISLQVPRERIAEMVGMLGTSGFLGMALGPTIGDALFGSGEVTQWHVRRMFWVSAGAGIVAILAVALAGALSQGQVAPTRYRRLPILALARKYHPGLILLVSSATGLAICMPHEFLRAFTADAQIGGIRNFFVTYALTALVVRLATRKVVARHGVGRVVTAGLLLCAGSMLSYLLVDQPWELAYPAMLGGSGHALLFPAVIAGGSVRFPTRYRGLATTLTLAMFDLGNLLGKPLIGGLLELSKRRDWPAYPLMFVSLAVTLLALAVFYAYYEHQRGKRIRAPLATHPQ